MSISQEKVIIVGAGIIGLMTALELLEQGYQVEIFDQSTAASAASWAGGGILSPLYPWKYAAAVNQLAQYGKRRYLAWNEKLQPYTGMDFEIEQVGLCIFDQDQYAQALNYHQEFHEPEQIAYLLEDETLKRVNPHLAKDSATYFPQLANIRNPRLVQSILKYLHTHKNVVIHQHNAITKLLTTAQRITAVEDHTGQHHHADQYVIATGAWADILLQQFDLKYDIHPIHGQMVLYKTPEKWLPTICMNKTMYLIPRRDGHIVCGSSTSDFGFDTGLHDDISQNIIEASLTLVPELARFPIVKQWAGLRPASPQGIPKIGRMQDMTNLWLNAGHYRNGLVMAPASARLLVELMQGKTPFVDARPYQCG